MAQGKLLGNSTKQAETWSITSSIWISPVLLYHCNLLFLSFLPFNRFLWIGSQQCTKSFWPSSILLAHKIVSGLRKKTHTHHKHTQSRHWKFWEFILDGTNKKCLHRYRKGRDFQLRSQPSNKAMICIYLESKAYFGVSKVTELVRAWNLQYTDIYQYTHWKDVEN